MGTWRRHSREFKRQAVERMKASDNIHALARELGVERKLLYTWKWQFEGQPEKNHANYSGKPTREPNEVRLHREIRQLKESLGQKTAEVDFFAAALRRVNQDRPPDGTSGEPASTPRSRRSRARKAV